MSTQKKTTIAIVYHSGFGHTAVQAENVKTGAEAGGAEAMLIDVEQLATSEDGPWEALNDADAIIFGSPTYMGSVSAQFETFADASSKVWQQGKWVDKIAAGFTNSGSLAGDKQSTLIRMSVLAAQHGMIWVPLGLPSGDASHPGDDSKNLNRLGFFLGAAAQSDFDKGPDENPGRSDLATAHHLGKRVAQITSVFSKGKQQNS